MFKEILINEKITLLSMSFVWAAEMQKRARDSMMGVAGKPTTTTPMFLFNISLPNALLGHTGEDTKTQCRRVKHCSRQKASISDIWSYYSPTAELLQAAGQGPRLTLSWRACRASWVQQANSRCRRWWNPFLEASCGNRLCSLPAAGHGHSLGMIQNSTQSQSWTQFEHMFAKAKTFFNEQLICMYSGDHCWDENYVLLMWNTGLQ